MTDTVSNIWRSHTELTPKIRGDLNEDPTKLPYFDIVTGVSDDCKQYQIFVNMFRDRGIWGFAIFRTVYTPESNQLFPLAIAKIERHVRTCLAIDWSRPKDFKHRFPADRQRLVGIIMDCFQNCIFEDQSRFENATAEDLDPYFRLWLADIERNYRSNCFGYDHFMILDEESLRSITAAPDEVKLNPSHNNKAEAEVNSLPNHRHHSSAVQRKTMNTHRKDGSEDSEEFVPNRQSMAGGHSHLCEDDCGKYQDFITKFKRRGIWGFVIFRTVYTPESDEQFPIAIAKLDDYVRLDLESDTVVSTSHKNCSPIERQRLIDTVMDCYKNTIFEDRETCNNANAKDLSTHFRLWLASIEREYGYHQCFGYSHFIIIDEESLNAITAPPSDIVHEHDCPCGPHASAATFEPIIKLVRIYDRVVYKIAPYELWFKYFWGSSDHV